MAANNWPEKIVAFLRSPSEFLSCTTPDAFLAELLRELRDDRASDNVKVKHFTSRFKKDINLVYLLCFPGSLLNITTFEQHHFPFFSDPPAVSTV